MKSFIRYGSRSELESMARGAIRGLSDFGLAKLVSDHVGDDYFWSYKASNLPETRFLLYGPTDIKIAEWHGENKSLFYVIKKDRLIGIHTSKEEAELHIRCHQKPI